MTSEDYKELILLKCIDAPSWVRCVGIDNDGTVYGSTDELGESVNNDYWIGKPLTPPANNLRRYKPIGKIIPPEEVGIDWKETKIYLR